jgi:HPt (histidine-containing phosphotransfer) domain-containing protein
MMTDKFKQELEDLGTDVKTALKRFMNKDALYEKFIKKFMDDHSYMDLQEAFADARVEDAFRAAHTMKGVCANLGFDNLLKILTPMTEVLRAGSTDGVADMLAQLKEEYEKLCSVIRANE